MQAPARPARWSASRKTSPIRTRCERLARQERLGRAGTLAAEVGDEINNPLTYVGANIELAIEEIREVAAGASPGAGSTSSTILEEARERTERIRKIVRGLRAFAREDVPVGAVDVWSTLATSIDITAHELRQERARRHPPHGRRTSLRTKRVARRCS